MEARVFRDMLEPFDPAEEETEQGVTDETEGAENPEQEAVRPKTRAPPKQPSAEEVENHMVTALQRLVPALCAREVGVESAQEHSRKT